jgi:hypothetical protein
MRKTVYTLNVDGYAPEITALTYPLIRHYAQKIGAEFYIITDRKFPGWPVVYEKLQIHGLGDKRDDEWSIYLDSDTIVHPDTIDFSNYIPKNTVAHNGIDFANVRWRYDKYFWRDGRNLGSCNWNTWASEWCRDLWRPLEISLEEAVSNIHPIANELNTVITPDHLIDDYALSCNIARFGLKATTLMDVEKSLGFIDPAFFWHEYTLTVPEKVKEMAWIIRLWKLPEKLAPAAGPLLDRWKDDFDAREKSLVR